MRCPRACCCETQSPADLATLSSPAPIAPALVAHALSCASRVSVDRTVACVVPTGIQERAGPIFLLTRSLRL